MEQHGLQQQRLIWMYDPTQAEIIDIESEPESNVRSDDEGGPEDLSYDAHFGINLQNYNDMVPNPAPIPGDRNGRAYLKRHTASNIRSKCLDPFHYRYTASLETLDELAAHLKAPANWRQSVSAAVNHELVRMGQQMFREPRNSRWQEATVEVNFSTLATLVGFFLGKQVAGMNTMRFGVGGLLPDPSEAVIGISDMRYSVDGKIKFVTEAKTSSMYMREELWCKETRACQSLGALYYSGLPVLLYSPLAFKLLVEDEERSRVFCYPAGSGSGDTQSDDFLFVVGLLILCEGLTIDAPKTPIKAENLRHWSPRTAQQPYRLEDLSSQLGGNAGSSNLPSDHSDASYRPPGSKRMIYLLTESQLEEAWKEMEAEKSTFVSTSAENQRLVEEEAAFTDKNV